MEKPTITHAKVKACCFLLASSKIASLLKKIPETRGCEPFRHVSEEQVENWTVFPVLHQWSYDQDAECTKDLHLAGRVRETTQLSVSKGRKEAGMGRGSERNRWSLNPTTLKLGGTLRRTSSTPVAPR